jgi:uncharacterized OB-fold protein
MTGTNAPSLANNAPLPVLTAETEAFWTGGSRGALLIYRCAGCAAFIHPPSPICPHCHCRAVAPAAVSGKATVASFTINYQQWLPGMRVPFAIAVVALAEQADVHLTTTIVNAPLEAIHIGQKLRVLFERHGDVWLPLFEPDPCP